MATKSPMKRKSVGGAARPLVRRHSRDLKIELKKVLAALKRAQALAEKIEKEQARSTGARVTRRPGTR